MTRATLRARRRIHRWRLAMLAASLLVSGTAAALPAPSAPATSTGSYTVSVGGCDGCYAHWIEERSEGSTAWTTVGTGSVTFASKPAGAYDYRAAAVYTGDVYSYAVEYGPTTTVVVGSNLPVAETLGQQFGHSYTARVGNYDADGVPDLYIERTRGGSGADGTVYRLVLRATAGGFQPVVPSSTAAQSARRWPVAAVRLALHDVDVDGFVDLLIGGIGRLSGLAGKPAQIVLAPGRVGRTSPKAVKAVSGRLLEFGRDVQKMLVEPDYFEVHAPLVVATVTNYDFSCQFAGFDMPIYGFAEYCYPFPVTSYFVIPDYSEFSSAAVAIARADLGIAAGSLSRTAGYGRIETVVEETLGSPLGDRALKELLGEGIESIEPGLERGVELFQALAGIGNAVAQEAEGRGTGTVSADSVLLTGRRIIGFGPFHTALQYGISTISAFDSDLRTLFDGTLVSQVDWPPDHPALTLRLGRVTAALTPPLYWQRLLTADSGYRDHLPYDAIPGLGAGGYNSNGFVAGIVRATGGVASRALSGFVGGERPVPRSEFR